MLFLLCMAQAVSDNSTNLFQNSVSRAVVAGAAAFEFMLQKTQLSRSDVSEAAKLQGSDVKAQTKVLDMDWCPTLEEVKMHDGMQMPNAQLCQESSDVVASGQSKWMELLKTQARPLAKPQLCLEDESNSSKCEVLALENGTVALEDVPTARNVGTHAKPGNRTCPKPSEGEGLEPEAKKQKKSFANRNPPKNPESLIKWRAMKLAFENAADTKLPAFEETSFYKFCQGQWKDCVYDEDMYKKSAIALCQQWMATKGLPGARSAS